jgi:hypothetical protein
MAMYISLGKKQNEGGNSLNNDCLYYCLEYYLFNIKKIFGSPADFKKWLKLGRNDKVPLNCIDKIEKELKNFQINVRGDYVRSSTIQSNKIININLTNGHYSVEKPIKANINPYQRFNEKKLLLFDKKTFEAYDGETKWVLTKQEMKKHLFNHNSEYILVDRETKKDENNQTINITIEEEFKEYIEIADKLKQASNGLINLYKSGNYIRASLDLFDKTTKYLQGAEPILQDEAEWIQLSSYSFIIWREEYEGELFKYDVKSCIPYLMTLNTNKFPIKRGEFLNIKEFPEYLQFGIYRCVILPSQDESINRMFKFNNKGDYYTSNCINHARKLGLEVVLINDDKPNFLYYSRDKLITMNEVFKNYVDVLFKLKEANIPKSKQLLTILWGSLCEKDKKKHFIKDEFKLDNEEEIIEIYPCSNDDSADIIKTIKRNNMYKTPYARISPFIISYTRTYVSNIMLPHKDYIKRVQTDGFFTTKLIHTNQNVKLGELKYEGGTSHGIITHCNNKVEIDKNYMI